jgi:Tol biopolymer transport system component
MKYKRVISPRILTAVLLIFTLRNLQGQSTEMKNIFTQAESYFIYEEYELANQLYLLIETPDNMNIKHKIGTCYLNIPGEKEKAVAYLEEAAKNMSFDSKTDSYKELKAPPDVYFSLAKAYMINGYYEKALTTLQDFSKLTDEAGAKGQMENSEFVDQQIAACKNAIQYKQVPVPMGKEQLSSDFSMGAINENPVVSFDGNTIAYTEKRGIENAIFYSRKTSGNWEPPVEITGELNAGTDCTTASLNTDGTELYLYKTDDYDGAIYVSNYADGKWSPIKKLNKNINTKYYESHASISSDGSKLYFSSNREGGFGNLDIYVSEKDASGEWGPAKNLGPEINTPFNEDTPFITMNDSLLYFCSEGHNSMGGYDNFKSQKLPSGWRTPNNLGYPVNSADDDKFFSPFNNGKNGYYSMTTGYKEKDIFYLDLEKSSVERPYAISGKLQFADSLLSAVNKKSVRVINIVTGDTLYNVLPDETNGAYSVNVESGLFRILFSGEGYISQSVDTMLIGDASALNLDITLLKDTTWQQTPEVEKYEKINLSLFPVIADIDTSILIRNVKVSDDQDKNVSDEEVLYYTVQVIALHKPVDATYFKFINDIKILYNEDDKFYRYTTGSFQSKDAAYQHRTELIRKGYPKQIFVKKISSNQ